MTTIQIRIDKKTKNSAKKILDKLGLDMISAIKIYLNQISEQKGIPFPLYTENGLAHKTEMEILKASREAKQGKNVSKAMDADEAISYLENL